jgi:hypothetical protein
MHFLSSTPSYATGAANFQFSKLALRSERSFGRVMGGTAGSGGNIFFCFFKQQSTWVVL